jgi:hypothetical protein
MAAKRGGAGGEATIDMIDLRIGRKASPDTPTSPSVLKPRSPRPGLILFCGAARLTRAQRFNGPITHIPPVRLPR